MDHEHDEECACCKDGVEETLRRQAELIEKVGWFSHIVPDQTAYNYHTHGLPELLNCPDLQVLLPIDPNKTHSLITSMINEAKEKAISFKAGEKFVVPNFKSATGDLIVLFVKAREGDREVLRVILPDKKGNLGRDAEVPFCDQYQDIPVDVNLN